MGSYENQHLDFVIRTKEIINQYDKFIIDPKEKYEVTLLLNCFIGLLVLPQQYSVKELIDSLPDTTTNKKDWGIDPSEIRIILKKKNEVEDKTIGNITRHLRNSISHYHFKAQPERVDDIKEIRFLDYLS